MDTTERRVWGERRPKDRVTLQIILVFTFTHPKTFTQGCVSVCDKYLYWIYMSYIRLLTLTRTTLVGTVVRKEVRRRRIISPKTRGAWMMGPPLQGK
jgi:hypothetical protein